MFPSGEELKERYSAWHTHSLLSVLHNKEEYTPLAVEVARAELAKRQVTAEDVDDFLQKREQQEITRKILSCFHLTFWEKALSFFVWFAPWFLGGAFRMNYGDDGFVIKMKQSKFFSIAGFLSLMVDAFLSVYFHLETRTSIYLLIFFFVIFCWRETKLAYDLTS